MDNFEQLPNDRKHRFPMTRVSDYSPSCLWDYSVKGLLRRREVSLLYGPPNCGKSALAVLLSTIIAAGKTYHGAKSRSGLVIYVAAEAPRSILDRFAAKKIDAEGTDFPCEQLLVVQDAVNLGDRNDVGELSAQIEGIGCGTPVALIVFDTLSLSIGTLCENNPGEMTEVVQNARSLAQCLGTHVMLIHHTGKDDSRGYRGTSALKAAVDTEIRLEAQRDKKQGHKGETEVIANVILEKQRTMPKSLTSAYGLRAVRLGADEDDEDFTSVVAYPTKPMSGNAAKEKVASYNARMAVLRAVLQHRTSLGGSALVFRSRELLSEFPEGVLSGMPDSQRKALDRLLDELARTDPELVGRTPEGWRIL